MTAILLFILAGWVLLGVAVTITNIGKPREPMLAGGAAVVVFISIATVALLIVAAVQLIGLSA